MGDRLVNAKTSTPPSPQQQPVTFICLSNLSISAPLRFGIARQQTLSKASGLVEEGHRRVMASEANEEGAVVDALRVSRLVKPIMSPPIAGYFWVLWRAPPTGTAQHAAAMRFPTPRKASFAVRLIRRMPCFDSFPSRFFNQDIMAMVAQATLTAKFTNELLHWFADRGRLDDFAWRCRTGSSCATSSRFSYSNDSPLLVLVEIGPFPRHIAEVEALDAAVHGASKSRASRRSAL